MSLLSSFLKNKHNRIISIYDRYENFIGYKRLSLANDLETRKNFVNELILIEDSNFFQNWGLNIRGLLRAFMKNLQAFKIVEGGSGITQQVVKNIFPCKFKIVRKMYEIPLAVIFTGIFNKEKIIDFYINHAYLGKGVNGFESASYFYFHKPSSELKYEEKIALLSLLTRPEYWIKNPLHLIKKTHSIALKLKKNLDSNVVENACLRIHTVAAERETSPSYEYLNKLEIEKFQHSVKVNIDTRVDLLLAKILSKYEKQYNFTVILYDYRKFAIRSLISRENGVVVKRNVLSDYRKFGSLLKPFLIYSFEKNNIPYKDVLFESKPLSVEVDGKIWNIKNYNDIYRGKITLLEAISYSDNTACVQALQLLGLENFKKTLLELEIIDSSMRVFPSIVLGATDRGIKVENLLRAYSLIASFKTFKNSPFLNEDSARIGPSKAIIEVRKSLSSVVNVGTAAYLKPLKLIGGKTGSDQNTLSFIGYDSNYAVMVQAQERHQDIYESFSYHDDKSYSIFDMVGDVFTNVRSIFRNESGKADIYAKHRVA